MKAAFSTCIAVLSFLAGCAPKTSDKEMTIRFEGRDIDLAPYFEEFPYQYFNVSQDGSRLLFFKSGARQKLQTILLSEKADIRNAEDVTDIDFSKQNCWEPSYNPADGFFYWKGDENNDELINCYRTAKGSGKVEKLTDVPYIYASGFSPDGKQLAYVARMAQYENRLDELHILNLETLEDRLVCKDGADFRYTWGEISWQPEGKGVLLLALKGQDRTCTNLLYVDLATGESRVVTDPRKHGSLSGTAVTEKWIDNDNALFVSDQDGYSNLYRFTLSTGKTEQITSFKMNVDKAAVMTVEGRKLILALQSNPIESRIILLDPVSKEVVCETTSPLSLSLGAVKDSVAYLTAAGTTTLFHVSKAVAGPDGIAMSSLMETPADIRKKLVHSAVERLEIPTWDTDPATGRKRLLHAYLFKPDKPLPVEKSLLMVESFYGGMNSYQAEYQIYNQAGMYVLSVAPRGSDGFGRDFAALNDGDLGGGETLDMIYATKFVADSLGIPHERVGAFGMSHGGYETMRLMTFPGEVKGVKARFPFGFGIEAAGFCDIGWIYRHTNIPDWITLEAGDPVKDSLLWIERSPITWADKITGPLLLIHGTADNRVDIGGSQAMADKLQELGKPHRFVKFEGQGHGCKGTGNQLRYYTECLGFIEEHCHALSSRVQKNKE